MNWHTRSALHQSFEQAVRGSTLRFQSHTEVEAARQLMVMRFKTFGTLRITSYLALFERWLTGRDRIY